MGRVVILILKLTHEAETQAWMYILYLFKAVFIAHDISLEKKGLECVGVLKRLTFSLHKDVGNVD